MKILYVEDNDDNVYMLQRRLTRAGFTMLIATDAAGVLNMNGGDTLITRADPSLTRVAPLGIPRGRHYQVYAPNQNENVYTELWRGPYYGYERVIETFELTELPRRLKPVNIYYHAYSATKTASLAALSTFLTTARFTF